MGRCALCSKNGKDFALFGANHKDRGYIMVCQDCWMKLYKENRIVAGSSSSGDACSCK